MFIPRMAVIRMRKLLGKLHRYFGKSYRRELQLLFTMAAVVPLVVGGFVLVGLFRVQTARDLARQDLQARAGVQASLENVIDQVDEAIESVGQDADITAAMSSGRVVSSNVYAALYRQTANIRSLASVDIYLGAQRIYSTDSGQTAASLPEDFGILARAAAAPGTTVYAADYPIAFEEGGKGAQDPCLVAARQIKDTSGYVVVTITQERLDELLQGTYRASEGILLLNRFWEPVYAAGALGQSEAASLFRNNLMAHRAASAGYTDNYYSAALGNTGLTLIYLTPPALSPQLFNSMMRIVLIFALLAVPFGLVTGRVIANVLARPITRLNDGMRQLRHGDLHAHVNLERDDEFGQLADGFNRTVVQIRDNMESQLAQQKKLNDTEIAMMQAQLNPHFLYNTLDTIKWVAKSHNIPEIAELSRNLAKLLRESINSRPMIRLSDELDLVESYCSIQEFRFDNSFSYECEVPEELMAAQVPKLILQPVVENAIIHGLEGVEDGLVKVTAGRAGTEGEDLRLVVTDNGHGIDAEMIRILGEHHSEELEGHLGFRNVDTILRMYYGADYGIRARRRPEGGTEVELLLPLRYS